MEDHRRDSLNFINLIRFIFRWLYYFVGICLASGLLAYILASPLVTEPVYKSSTTFYPTSKGSISTEVLRDFSPGDEDYLDFGEEKQVENYLEILRSNRIKNHLLDKFNLMEHYEIDKDAKKPYVKFQNKYESNFSFTKTEFMALEVEVFDKDPQLAAKMANEVVRVVDSFVNSIKKERAKETMQMVKKKYLQQEKRYDKLADSVQKLGEMGLVQFESQSEALTEALGDAKLKGRTRVIENLEDQLAKVGKYGPIYYTLMEEMVYTKEKISDLHTKYQKIQADAEGDLPKSFILDKAQVNNDEAKPKKLLMLILTLVGAFLVTFVVLSLYEKWPSIREAISDDNSG